MIQFHNKLIILPLCIIVFLTVVFKRILYFHDFMFPESMDPEQLRDKYYDETINRKFAKLTTYVVQNLYFSLLPFFCKKISYIHHSLRKLK